MDLDPERLRLKRMEEAMEAERRSLQEDKRRLEQERAQMDGQRHAAAPQSPPAAPLSQATWSPAAAEQPQPSGSKGGLFLGLAGGVLLVGVLLVAGKAWLQAKADENVGIEADASGAPGQTPSPVLAAVVPAEPAADADAASAEDAQTDTAATPELDAVAAAAAPTPEAVDAGASDPDADATQQDTADQDAAGPGAATQLKAEGAAPDLKAEAAKPEAAKAIKKASRPVPTPVKPKPEPKPEPAKKADASGLKIDQSALGAQMRKEQEKKKQLEIMGKEFKKSQAK
jgi:hypothetical protein